MRLFLAIGLALASMVAQGQQSPIDTGMAWVRGAWAQVQKQGKPAAEKLIREFPDRFKAVPAEVAKMQKQADQKLASMRLDEKKSLIEELWRVRHCVNLMALVDSGMLERITGIDTKTLKSVTTQITKLEAALQPKRQ